MGGHRFRRWCGVALFCSALDPVIRQSHQVLADQLMHTGFSAEMPGPGGQSIRRVPATDAQLSRFLAGNKPMVRLPLRHAAHIAGYDLLDQCRPLPMSFVIEVAGALALPTYPLCIGERSR